MSESENVTVVRRLYGANGDPAVIQSTLSPDIRWEVFEGFPYSGVYEGVDGVLALACCKIGPRAAANTKYGYYGLQSSGNHHNVHLISHKHDIHRGEQAVNLVQMTCASRFEAVKRSPERRKPCPST